MSGNVVKFPSGEEVNNAHGDDLSYLLEACEIIMGGTNYAELIMVGLTEDNDIEVIYTETNDRTVEILDRAIVEQFLGEDE